MVPGADRAIFSGIATVFVFASISALVGAGKEVAIAWRFGVGSIVDAYQFLFTLAQWPLSLLATLFTVTLVPLVAKLSKTTPTDLRRFQAEVLGVALVAVAPICVAVYFGLSLVVTSTVVGLDSAVRGHAEAMLAPFALSIGFGMLAVLLGGWIMAENRHSNTLLQSVPALIVLLAVLGFASGSKPLAWATALGFAAWALASWLVLGSRHGVRWPQLSLRSPHWQALLAGMGTLLFGQLLMSLVSLVDQFFAARLGVGALSTLGYSNRIVALVLGLCAIAITRGMLPTLSQVNVDSPGEILPVTQRFALLVLGLGLVLAIAGALASDWFVRVLFERGQFLRQDSEMVAELVRYSMFQVPFYLASMVIVSALLAQRRYTTVMFIAGLNGLVKVGLALVLVSRWGLPGLLLATAAVYLLSTLHCYLHLRFGSAGTAIIPSHEQ